LKRCPECNSFFPDAEHFCELDGTTLVTVDDAHSPVSIGAAPQAKSSQSVLIIGALACVLLGVLLVLVYFAMSRQTALENSDTLSSNSSVRQQEPVALPPAPLVTASPSVEPSVEPSASPSIETPSPQTSSAQLELSRSNPAAGAKGGSDPVIIRLHSGVTIEADEAWQTAEGVWYRKSGVVSLLDPASIKAIEKVSPAAPQPSASTPSP
jgi:cytoskeletal protein RodZ